MLMPCIPIFGGSNELQLFEANVITPNFKVCSHAELFVSHLFVQLNSGSHEALFRSTVEREAL